MFLAGRPQRIATSDVGSQVARPISLFSVDAQAAACLRVDLEGKGYHSSTRADAREGRGVARVRRSWKIFLIVNAFSFAFPIVNVAVTVWM